MSAPIRDTDILQKLRNTVQQTEGIGGQPILSDTVVPVLVLNPNIVNKRVESTTASTIAGDVNVLNSTTANSKSVSVVPPSAAGTLGFNGTARTRVETGVGQGGTAMGVANTALDLYTVTAGKKFYCTSIFLSANTAGGYAIRDSATVKFSAALAANAVGVQLSFPVPLEFSTAVTVISNAASPSIWWGIVGFEE